jgi:hypothetical protein
MSDVDSDEFEEDPGINIGVSKHVIPFCLLFLFTKDCISVIFIRDKSLFVVFLIQFTVLVSWQLVIGMVDW